MSTYWAILTIDPSHEEARARLEEIRDYFVARARRDEGAGDLPNAARELTKALLAAPGDPSVTAHLRSLSDSIASASEASK